MTLRLRELVRSVRQAKTAAEERALIAKECANIRTSFKDAENPFRHRNVAKLLYINMLGYPTHFGQMECLKLIAASSFPEKRMGYLGVMLILDEAKEVLMLVTNSLKNDLSHKNQYVTGLALCTLGNIGSAEMCRDLSPEVQRLLSHTSAYIRKKAVLAAYRVVRKVPDLMEEFVEPCLTLMRDRHHGVLLATLELIMYMCAQEPELIEKYRPKVPDLVQVIKSLVLSGFTPDHDIAGVTDPFLQVKALRLLRVLGAGDATASDQMSDILAQVASNVEGNKNAGNAILYECVQTIMGVESIGGNRSMAVNILGRFLGNRDNNIRYVALNLLAKVVRLDAQAVQRHRNTIVECVKDSDVSIRRRALDLVYALVNANNITTLSKELIEYLGVSDSEFKADLTSNICALIAKFAPDKRWHIDCTVKVFEEAGEYAQDAQSEALIILITNAPEMHGYAVRRLYTALSNTRNQMALMLVGIWCIGEYGDVLVKGESYLEEEEQVTVTESDVIKLLDSLAKQNEQTFQVKEMVVTAYAKLSTRFPNSAPHLQTLIESFQGSLSLELQQRACEYSRLFQAQHHSIKTTLLEQMPPLTEEMIASRTKNRLEGDEEAEGSADVKQTMSVAAAEPVKTVEEQAASDAAGLVDLLDMMGDDAAPPPAAQPAAAAGGNDLLDLLGGDPTPAPGAPAAAAPPADNLGGLADLLGGDAAPAPTPAAPAAPADPVADILGAFGSQPAPAPAAPAPVAGADPFAGMMGGGAPAPAPAAPGTFPPVIGWQKNGVTVTFNCTKPNPAQPALTNIVAVYTNSTPTPITNFALQAAVPTVMQLQMFGANGNTLPPNNGGSITQNMQVMNRAHGQKPIVMRLKISYNFGGMPIEEQATANTFPPNL
mmetsp:Transcript_3763/g.4217  ORF Transcript_3763/g.4217 Transcript_3763/m.4217 type:complete len:885 (-) Transcript_3763:299-2953(-)|eukprot:CAMPEP_0197868420 /NCGR_PEP_ID=MMETSP1438-20131217/45274_1 /TAXON_ID=1461541 /ORGANISM="Pterosperma sp., Strain CCMP1384" /LENGTH=884 /DNA_ID=CAMNT_0043487127 /DNA_START=215 /DNA_END=2869 /DNA_ORIENTATION=+